MSETVMKYIPYFALSSGIILLVSVLVLTSGVRIIKRQEPTYTLDIGLCDEAKDLGSDIYLVRCNQTFDVRRFKAENSTLKPSIRGISLTKEQYDKLCNFPFVVKN